MEENMTRDIHLWGVGTAKN